MLPDLAELCSLVRTAAQQELLPRFAARPSGHARAGQAAPVSSRSRQEDADVRPRLKLDGSVVTEVDHAMQDRMRRELGARWPRFDFIGEEMSPEEHGRLATASAAGLWCLDPLDGTSNYVSGIPFFAVSLALLMRGKPEIGLVYDPVRDECFVARRGQGAWRDRVRLHAPDLAPPELRRCIGAVDFKRLTAGLAARLSTHPPYRSQRNFGASSLEWCWLADGRFHVYLHGGQQLWDYASGSLVLAEAGGYAETLDGEPVFQLALVARSVVAALDEALFASWRAWVRAEASE